MALRVLAPTFLNAASPCFSKRGSIQSMLLLPIGLLISMLRDCEECHGKGQHLEAWFRVGQGLGCWEVCATTKVFRA